MVELLWSYGLAEAPYLPVVIRIEGILLWFHSFNPGGWWERAVTAVNWV